MDENEVIKKMQNAINGSRIVQTNKPKELELKKNESQKNVSFENWLENLPQIPEDGFLIKMEFEKHMVVFCVKELEWTTSMNIDMKSYRVSEKDLDYYAEEYERRNTLSRAILWVADSQTQVVLHNHNYDILEKIDYTTLDLLWQKYKIITRVTTQEAQTLYESTKKFLNNEAQEGVPIPSIIPITIAICDGWSSLSVEELKKVSTSDWDRMQIIKMARAEIIESRQIITPSNDQKENSQGNFFEKWIDNFPIGHPNRPNVI